MCDVKICGSDHLLNDAVVVLRRIQLTKVRYRRVDSVFVQIALDRYALRVVLAVVQKDVGAAFGDIVWHNAMSDAA